MTGQVLIVPCGTMVPGGTGPALQSIPMGGISHPAQEMACPLIIWPFVVTLRVY